MICHLKAGDLGIPTIATKTTKEVTALINDGLKGENEKVEKKSNSTSVLGLPLNYTVIYSSQ